MESRRATLRLMSTLDFWFEFASSYSYPAAMRIDALAAGAGVTVRWRPFLLAPVFKAQQGWEDSPFNMYPAKGRYMWRDLERICAAQGLPFVKPTVFPQNTLVAARVALVALKQGWGEDFCRGIFSAEFGHGRNIGETFAVADVINALGRNPDEVIDESRLQENKDALRAETEQALRLDIFGSPSFITGDGELFWGNDRLEAALAWAQR